MLAHFTHNRAQDVGTATQLRSSVLRPATANTIINTQNAAGAKHDKLDVVTWWKKEAQVDWSRVLPFQRQEWRNARWDMIETQVIDTNPLNVTSTSINLTLCTILPCFYASKLTNGIMQEEIDLPLWDLDLMPAEARGAALADLLRLRRYTSASKTSFRKESLQVGFRTWPFGATSCSS